MVATVALPAVDYAPRGPAADLLNRVVREHLQTFLAEAALAEAAHLRNGRRRPRRGLERANSHVPRQADRAATVGER